MKKNDLILIGALLIIAFTILGITRVWQRNNTDESAMVIVTVDGQEMGRFPLNQDMEQRFDFPDGSYNVLRIYDGNAEISEASCPDQICVKHHKIHYTNETIVCLPNKLVVEITGGEVSDVDTIAN
ncbi:hypothetical protein SAMN05421493_10150 [Pseudobutyrivibrio sp. 49]|uniref:NusG domain II-containing protein n=1 Tax=unclassified Pseudobutyrivibrio TaxID=2638619 RepID=UPI00088F492C|nr:MULTISPECIES: NusG domain II-containing protein [unclassified Pseudobutyrivibrio]SDH26402.1 hypothetical protein SAMN05421493_10150 [Pseudobutyrivibrio sp. 49]SFO17079.1 hypothetical protein SAMN04487831_11070 [Pseudobutyrivibrio sp. UC1225]